jgi:hypothetical protein
MERVVTVSGATKACSRLSNDSACITEVKVMHMLAMNRWFFISRSRTPKSRIAQTRLEMTTESKSRPTNAARQSGECRGTISVSMISLFRLSLFGFFLGHPVDCSG